MPDDTLEKMIEAIENDDPVKEIFELMLARIKALETRIAEPPVKPGKRP